MKKIYDKRKIRKALDIDIYPRGGGKIDLRVFADTADSVSLGSDVQSEPASNDSTIFGDSDAYVAIITNPDAQTASDLEFEYIDVNDFYEFQDGAPVDVKSGYDPGLSLICYKSRTDLNGIYKIARVEPDDFGITISMTRYWSLNEDGYYMPFSPGSAGSIS